MFEQIVIFLFIIVISIFVAYPYFFSHSVISDEQNDSLEKYRKIKKLNEQREIYYSDIKDIEFDYGLGKLNEDDYNELLQLYKLKAANVLKNIENLQKDNIITKIDEDIEKEIRNFRKLPTN